MERRTLVLHAVVTEYLKSGQPTGSRTLTLGHGLGLSPATVRTVLKELEDEGFLSQPHTSAGRIPTSRALRLYVDALMKTRGVAPDQMERIRALFEDRPGRAWPSAREVAELLSDLSGTAAVVLQSRSAARIVRKVRFIPTRPGELLTVVALEDGSVENRFLSVDTQPDGPTLERLHHLLDEAAVGRSLADLRAHLAEMGQREPSSIGALGQMGDALVQAALAEMGASEELVISGRSSLLEEGQPMERSRHLLFILEDRKALVRLLDQAIRSDRVQVFLGSESALNEDVSLVAAGFGESGGIQGALGVLGPPEMDYPGLIPLIESLAVQMRQSFQQEQNARPLTELERAVKPRAR